MRAFSWTPEAVERLHVETEAGGTARQIADILGCTRNAVIGKWHRLGVKSKNARYVSAQIVVKPIVERRAAPRPIVVDIVPYEPPPVGGVAMADVGSGQCRWPMGDPRTDDFRFCGGSAQGPYCASHHRLAYRVAA